MNNKELYKATFSQVHTDVKIDVREYQKVGSKKSVHKISKRMAITVAAACLILAFSVTSFAMNLFGVKDLVLSGNKDTEGQSPVMISLQGFSDSNEYKAVAEWTAFLGGYDRDGALLSKVGNGPTGLDDRYSLYLVYTQEMADKLDEIVSKYNLKLHSSIEFIYNAEDLYNKAGTGNFLGTANKLYDAYVYEDGTFHIDGEAVLGNGKTVAYQFMNCKKGSFTDTLLNIGNLSNYTEWAYTTASGETVILSISPYKALVIADLDNSFVTINVLAGTEKDAGEIIASDLEAFADTFDFSALK